MMTPKQYCAFYRASLRKIAREYEVDETWLNGQVHNVAHQIWGAGWRPTLAHKALGMYRQTLHGSREIARRMGHPWPGESIAR